jgi:hypothetical protein
VLGIKTEKPCQKHVLTALAIRTNTKTDTCHPSYERLMSDTGLSRCAVSDALKYLRDKLKVLTWKQGHSNQYTKPMANLYHLDYRAMLALAEKSAESDLESAESETGVAEYMGHTPTAKVSDCSISTTTKITNADVLPENKDFQDRQEGKCVAPQSVVLSTPLILSKIPDYLVYDHHDRRWYARQGLDRGLSPAEQTEMKRLNSERITPE